jgi:hypothetical protein
LGCAVVEDEPGDEFKLGLVGFVLRIDSFDGGGFTEEKADAAEIIEMGF